jgi:hypothetical protein
VSLFWVTGKAGRFLGEDEGEKMGGNEMKVKMQDKCVGEVRLRMDAEGLKMLMTVLQWGRIQ